MYPLTEDLRPGDVFLVTRTIEEDQAIFRKKGFLPLDLNLARLDVTEALKAASAFQHPIGNTLDGAIWPSAGDAQLSMSRAAFPSYSVSVDRRSGLELALPIHAVPVALSAMRAETGVATVTLSGACTYGLDAATARRALESWFEVEENRELVKPIAGGIPGDGHLWLRVVSRVYLVRSVTVDVATSESMSGSVAAQPEIPADLEGKLEFVSAGERSVTLDETFERPLVVGYVGFQVAVDRQGHLMSGIASTLAVLDSGELPAYGADEGTQRIQGWLDEDPSHGAALKEYLAGLAQLGDDAGVTRLLFENENAAVRRAVIDRFDIP